MHCVRVRGYLRKSGTLHSDEWHYLRMSGRVRSYEGKLLPTTDAKTNESEYEKSYRIKREKGERYRGVKTKTNDAVYLHLRFLTSNRKWVV